jgi:hypothetical protein
MFTPFNPKPRAFPYTTYIYLVRALRNPHAAVQVRRWNEAKPKDAPQDRQPNSAGLVPIDEDDDDDDEWWEANDDEDDDVAYSPAVPPPTPRSGPVPDLCAPPLFPMTEMTAAPVASNSWSEWDGDDYGDSSSDTDSDSATDSDKEDSDSEDVPAREPTPEEVQRSREVEAELNQVEWDSSDEEY